MRLGLSSPLSHGSPEEWAERMAALGCGAVVFPVNSSSPEEVIEAYRAAAEKHGLVIAEVGVWNNMLAADGEERRRAVDYAVGQLKMADKIGAVCCVNVAGTFSGPRWDGGYRGNFSEETWAATVSAIREVIDRAEPVRACFSIESMPWMIPTGPDEYVRLIEEVDRERFCAHLDIVNMITSPRRYFFSDEFLRECFEKLSGRICSCHLKDIRLKEEYTFQLEETSCGRGNLNLELFKALADAESPDMPMIIEHLSTDEEYLDSLEYVRARLSV